MVTGFFSDAGKAGRLILAFSLLFFVVSLVDAQEGPPTTNPPTATAKQPAAQSPHTFRPVRLLPGTGVGVQLPGVSVQLPGGTQLVVPMADPESLLLVIDILARLDADRVGGSRPC